MSVEVKLSALSASFAEILEITEPGLGGGDEQKVVVVVGAEPSGAPAQMVFRPAAHPGFESSCDHLFERWIAGQGVGQFARLIWIGTTEFDRCGRAAAFAVAEIRV